MYKILTKPQRIVDSVFHFDMYTPLILIFLYSIMLENKSQFVSNKSLTNCGVYDILLEIYSSKEDMTMVQHSTMNPVNTIMMRGTDARTWYCDGLTLSYPYQKI